MEHLFDSNREMRKYCLDLVGETLQNSFVRVLRNNTFYISDNSTVSRKAIANFPLVLPYHEMDSFMLKQKHILRVMREVGG